MYGRRKKGRPILFLLHEFSPNAQYDKIDGDVLFTEFEGIAFWLQGQGEADHQSDYDLLIVTDETFAPRVKMNWENKIRKALIYSINLPFDIILQSQNEVDEKRNLTGHIVYFAMKEAVEI